MILTVSPFTFRLAVLKSLRFLYVSFLGRGLLVTFDIGCEFSPFQPPCRRFVVSCKDIYVICTYIAHTHTHTDRLGSHQKFVLI